MTELELADAAKNLFTSSAFPVYDGDAPDEAPARYCSLYTDAGQMQRDRYVTAAGTLVWGFQVVCVATTEDGLRALVSQVRSLCEGKYLGPVSSDPVREVAAGPRLSAGPVGDKRVSTTLIYQTHQARSIA